MIKIARISGNLYRQEFIHNNHVTISNYGNDKDLNMSKTLVFRTFSLVIQQGVLMTMQINTINLMFSNINTIIAHIKYHYYNK